MRALYLIAGTDGAKIDAPRGRLRARAEREAGGDALEVFEPGEGRGMPDHEALLAAIPAMSLMESRRYLLADGVERWRDRQLEAIAAAVGDLPPDLTLVLIARAKAPAKLTRAVKAAKGEIHEVEAPQAREMPRVRGAEGARGAAGAGRRRPAPRLPARARRRPPPGRPHGREPGPAPARARAPGAVGGRHGSGQRHRPRSDDRRHLRGRRLVAVGRPARTRRRRRPADRRAADRPGRERDRSDLWPRFAAAGRLRRRRPAGRGGPDPAGARGGEDASLCGEAAGREASQRGPRRAADGDGGSGRSGAVVSRRRRLRRRTGADPRPEASSGRWRPR